jgi:hypothetical protein
MRRKSRPVPVAVPQRYLWGSARSFEIARCLNERCLQWLARAATRDGAPPQEFFRRNRDLRMTFDTRACARAARLPIVLLDCNFRRVDWWMGVVNREVPSPTSSGHVYEHPFSEDAAPVLREILSEARTIAVSERLAASLVFGAPSAVVDLLSSLTVADIDQISARYVLELRPRWAEKPIFWRELLSASIGETDDAMSELYCHSLQLLGSDILRSMAAGERASTSFLRKGRILNVNDLNGP